MLEMMAAVDRICRDNGLAYFLFRGTLLGAVRENGFIPWDDDMDLAMPRPDFERFLEIAPALLPGHLCLKHHSNTGFYPYTYMKVMDTETTVVEGSTNYVCGVFVDIFPLDGADADSRAARWRLKRLQWYRLFFLAYYGGNDRVVKHDRWVRLVKKILHRTVCIKRWQRRYDRLCRAQGYDESERVAVLIHPMPAILREWLGAPTDHAFEGHVFCIPQQADSVLKALYGPNYMTPPPERFRVSVHRWKHLELDRGYAAYRAEQAGRDG